MLSVKSTNISMVKSNRSASLSYGQTGRVAQGGRLISLSKSFALGKIERQILALVGVIVIGIFTLLGLNSLYVSTGYTVDYNQKQLLELYHDNNRLRLSVAELKSPSRIQTIATKDLGMAMPQTFIYSSDKAAVVKSQAVETNKIHD